ncbi:2'-5' RNA ligase [Haloactinospora alba]|uniref:RNA 2',3'-cyclic phosphodiesterase n=1 Tax=Haloactinospora alba TaxID=405555 RepID=A0A543N762_9ACTN|nr:RNA 2',3'-cyclic phosphodiesterase [Haloactinospora alba]TQN27666.1 2'-5' RNA ligase [Haloactinospora alba]
MRLFLAVYPTGEVLDGVAEAVRELRDANPRLRWTGRDDWHLTLLFLGEVSEEGIGDLRERFAAEIPRHPRMRLAVRGAGTFPGDAASARVLWAGIEGDVDPLADLAGAVSRTARRAGVAVQRRPYVPHVTLARSREPVDASELRTELLEFATPFWEAGEVHLVHSRPGQQPRYRTVDTWALS